MRTRDIVLAILAAGLAVCCSKEQNAAGDVREEAPKIFAEGLTTRTSIDMAEADEDGNVPVLWTPDDQLGVYIGTKLNVLYTNAEKEQNVPETSFETTANVSGDISAVYYPYDSVNSLRSYTALAGNVPAEQAMNGMISGDYKWGEYRGNTEDGGHRFKFHNMFSLVNFDIDAQGTALEGEVLETVVLTVTKADGTPAAVTGDFTFNALDGSYTLGTVSNTLATTWNKTLDGTLSGFASVFPEIGKGDKLSFSFETANYVATLTVTSQAKFEPEMYYTFPLRLAGFSKLNISEKQTLVTGTFTAATYNIDGLPKKISVITINDDGPGSEGTTAIGSAIAEEGWDIVGFSEDFAYHTELTSAMGGYTFGKHRGSVSSITSNDTDGLCFATRNATCSYLSETIKEYDLDYGGISSGANTCIKKGFRHYPVKIAEGVVIDVYVTHMNTYSSSGSGHINAQHAQLAELATYVSKKAIENCRPAIIMGDTNCRYTRHDFKTYFWNKFDSSLTLNDPWVDYMWDGVYPTYPSNSLVVEDATGTSDSDIICDSQKGEVVDKVIYINNPASAVQITANGYLRDENFKGLADHWPIVIEFTYKFLTNNTKN